MKLLTYRLGGRQAVGALTGDGKTVLSLPYPDMNTLIETASLSDLRSAADAAERTGASVPLDAVELLAPIPRPRQDIICLGMNYRAHLEEAARYNADAFEKQLDSLYGAEALDISTDITVLENMMAREGLTDQPLKAQSSLGDDPDIKLEL